MWHFACEGRRIGCNQSPDPFAKAFEDWVQVAWSLAGPMASSRPPLGGWRQLATTPVPVPMRKAYPRRCREALGDMEGLKAY